MARDEHRSENLKIAYDASPQTIQPSHIQFKDIEYSVRDYKFGVWPSDTKKILQGVNGCFEGGKLTAIIGETGCGKTSLLNIVSGYRVKGFNGLVLMDGVPLDPKTLTKRTCYIQQDVLLQPLLTTYEAIIFVINMTFTSTMPQKEKRARASIIMEKSMLSNCKNTLAKNLSNGERKRLGLALELISDPSVVLLDELTSGLDSRSAQKCLKILRVLSSEGQTVICTIHQPSMQILQLFDNLYIMWRGRCLYQGAVDNLVDFLAANNFDCPRYHNPTEYLLELCILDGEHNGDVLVKAIDNGRSMDWMTKTNKLHFDSGHENETHSVSKDPGQLRENLPRFSFVSNEPIQLQKISDSRSSIYQFRCVLMRKFFLTNWTFFSLLMVVTSIGEGLAFGLLFYDKGGDARWMIFNYNIIFLVSMSIFYNNLTNQIISIPLEVQLTKREYLNGWYSMTTYWLSLTISIIPIMVVSTISLGTTFYYLAGYPFEGFRIIQFSVILVAFASFSQDCGTLFGVIFSAQKGLLIGVVSSMPLIVSSGFFVYNRDCKLETCRWMLKYSPLRKVFQETLFSAYGHNRKPLYCDLPSCRFVEPNDFFQFVDMKGYGEPFWNNFTFIVILCAIIKVATLFALKYKCSRGV